LQSRTIAGSVPISDQDSSCIKKNAAARHASLRLGELTAGNAAPEARGPTVAPGDANSTPLRIASERYPIVRHPEPRALEDLL